MEITETYGFRVSYAEFNGIDDKGNGSISLSSLYTLQSPLSRKFQFAELTQKRHKKTPPLLQRSFFMVTRTGIEPMLPP